jgi:predicted PurR-regulated permease PerM
MEIKSQTKTENIIFFILLAFITGLLFFILQPFFFAVFWAVLLASIFNPLYRLINKKIKNPSLCASITMMGIIFCFILPVGLLIDLLVMELIDIYQSFNAHSNNWIGTLTDALKSLSKHPLLAKLHIKQSFLIAKSQEAFKLLVDYFFSHISEFTQNTIVIIIQLAVMLYCLFYFMRDGKQLIEIIKRNIPVDNKHTEHFINQFLTTAKASLKFTFIIGGIQGFLGGFIFYVTGIDRALVWGVLMFAFSIVPAIGCSLIWAPAGIIMLLLGNVWQGIVILIFGAIVISSVDNLLRPVLMGRDTQMHALLIFLSTLGGIAVIGFSGFILGPVIASLFLAVWKLFPEIYHKEIK